MISGKFQIDQPSTELKCNLVWHLTGSKDYRAHTAMKLDSIPMIDLYWMAPLTFLELLSRTGVRLS
jgi:hypothetical protein